MLDRESANSSSGACAKSGIVMKLQTAIIVLAAGRGSRFAGPQHKLVQALGSRTVLGQTIAQAIASGLPVVVVTTDILAAEAGRWVARRDLVIVPAAGSASGGPLGMGFSIAAGVSARPQAQGWLVLPGDMPMVRPSTLVAVAQGLIQSPVVYAQHLGRRGHPVGFGAELYSELTQLDGDAGARRISARYPSVGLELGDPGVLIDVDTEADLATVRGLAGPPLTPASAGQGN